jgi:L-2-hydroxyglutarate oxidase LhgO
MFFDLTIVGAGVVGLSIARSCTELGMTVVVLEKHSRAGEGISSRNSGVIQAFMLVLICRVRLDLVQTSPGSII